MSELNYANTRGTVTVSYRKALSHNMPYNHFHSNCEVFFLMAGQREFFIKDRTIVIREGDVVIIPPNILHRTTNAQVPGHERLIVNIQEQHIAAVDASYADMLHFLFDQEYHIINGTLQDRLHLEQLTRGMIQEMQEKKPGFEMYIQSLVLQMLICCCRYREENRTEPQEFPSPMHERISEVVRFINNHYMEELSLQGLAQRFYVSPYYLSRFFKEATGFTFVEYVNSVRVKEAKKLLEQTALPVQQISGKVGFRSATHFGRVFKSITGHRPLFYRNSR